MATMLIRQIDRKIARENAKAIARHNLYRMYDAVSEALDVGDDPEALLVAVNKIASLAGKTQQAAHVYKGFFLSWRENEPALELEKPAEPEVVAVAKAEEPAVEEDTAAKGEEENRF